LEAQRAEPLHKNAANDPELARIFDEGTRLLDNRQWFDAKKRFEKGLRAFPDDERLRDCFATARRRYEISLRYQDSTFAALLHDSNINDALVIFDEVFENIDVYHVDDPSRETLFAYGLAGLAETLDETAFYERNNLPLERREAACKFIADVRESSASWGLRSTTDVRKTVLWIARQLRQKFEISETATVVEFLCSAVCSLDAYSAYLTPTQVNDVFSMIDGQFVGLGVELKNEDPSRVVRVIPNSPASECGVRAGDEIVAIDGRPTTGLSSGEIGALLQGELGSKVTLALQAPGEEERRVVAVRRQIEVPSVENAHILDAPGDVGYVKISQFQKTTAKELEAAIRDLQERGMRRLIVD
ncbi:MAG: PDZ domain-containing protein, partial [Thermoguttaceae bacterium]|nr:PDZ domain-containing protein [Thermoguttaceae bacterium]